MNISQRMANLFLLISFVGTMWSLIYWEPAAVVGWMVAFGSFMALSESDQVLSWSSYDTSQKSVTLQFDNEAQVTDFIRNHAEAPALISRVTVNQTQFKDNSDIDCRATDLPPQKAEKHLS